MNKIIPATKARQQFFKLIEQTDKSGQMITITINEIPKVVMMPAEAYEDWQETLEVLTNKKLMKGIAEGLRDIQEGKTYTQADIKKKFNL